MVLIQLLLPPIEPGNPAADAAVAETRGELVEAFGGVTAYVRAPAEGVWTAPDGRPERDAVVMVEVVAPAFDRGWWRAFAARLEQRFAQQAIHVRALPVDVLDEEAT